MSGAELGEKLGVSQPYIAELENPKMPAAPDLAMLEMIGDTFHVPPATLLVENFYNGGINLDFNFNHLSPDDKNELQVAIRKVVTRARSKAGDTAA